MKFLPEITVELSALIVMNFSGKTKSRDKIIPDLRCSGLTGLGSSCVELGESSEVINDTQHILEPTFAHIHFHEVNWYHFERIGGLYWYQRSTIADIYLLGHDTWTFPSNVVLYISRHPWPIETLLCQIDNLFNTNMSHFIMKLNQHSLVELQRKNQLFILSSFTHQDTTLWKLQLLKWTQQHFGQVWQFTPISSRRFLSISDKFQDGTNGKISFLLCT